MSDRRPPSELTAVIFAGGDAPTESEIADLRSADLTIAADSGFDHAAAHGLFCDLLVGDLDSISAAGLAAARAGSVEVIGHPVDKDRTDLELALEEARARSATRVIVVGGHGGRLDHQLANVAVLTAEDLAGVEVEARMAASRVHIVRDRHQFEVPVGALVSLLPAGGPAHGVQRVASGGNWRESRFSPRVGVG